MKNAKKSPEVKETGDPKEIALAVLEQAMTSKESGEKELTDEDLLFLTQGLVAKAKENIEHNGDLIPIAAIISKWGDVNIIGLPFKNQREKELSFNMVAGVAAMGHTFGLIKGVVTVMDAYIKQMEASDPKALENYKPGDLAKDPASGESLVVILTRPEHKPYAIMTGHTKKEGKINWDEQVIMDGDDPRFGQSQYNLMPDWTAMADSVVSMVGKETIDKVVGAK